MDDFPDWIEPMAATLTQDRFTAPGWIFERKLDGIRLLAYKQGANVRLYSRNRLPQTLPDVGAAIARLPATDLILDGELTWGSDEGGYHVFDILWMHGTDLTRRPWRERRELLEALPLRPPLHIVTLLDHGEPWEHARAEGWEGVIAKRVDSPYETRRSKHWLKMKCEVRETFQIGGFTEPRGSRVGLGAVLVGRVEGQDLKYVGKVGTGFDTRMLIDLRQRLDVLKIDQAPFTKGKGLPRADVHWVKPETEVDVGFIEWTVHGKLRHPRLLAIRGSA
jgi:bifunctional non-homologous end joining protein LigD